MMDTGLDIRPDFVADDSIERQILREVYRADEDGVMEGDIAMLLSPKVRPEIRDFIQQNLMQLKNPIVSSVPFDNLSDEDLIVLSPSPFDSYDSYLQRVNDYVSSFNEDK